MNATANLLRVFLCAIAGYCLAIGVDNMKKAFRCKKNPLTENERLNGWKILITISIAFFIAAFLLVVLGAYVYTRIAGTG